MPELVVDNEHFIDTPLDPNLDAATEAALADADDALLAEAYFYVGPNGERKGLHHVLRDGVLLVDRGRATYTWVGDFVQDTFVPTPQQQLDAQEHAARHRATAEQIGV